VNRIVIGQYYPADSPIHRLDPRVKLLTVIAYITVLIFATNFYGFALAALMLAGTVKGSRVPVRYLLRGLRTVLFILSFAVLINIFLTPGENVLFSFLFIRVTGEGIYRAALMGTRLVLLVTGSTLLTLTTSPIRLTDGIEALLKPLRLPAHDIAIMMTIALRMIPTIAEELAKITNAQKARGADFETGGPTKRARSILPILIPLFVSSFKRADDLATAMEARCYRGGEGRTKLKPLRITKPDCLAVIIVILSCTLLLLTRYI
jgi:energy-coupling factor transport system permease protein